MTFQTNQVSVLTIQTTLETSDKETRSAVTDLGSVTVSMTDAENDTGVKESTLLQETTATQTSGRQSDTAASSKTDSTDSSTREEASDHSLDTTQATIENQVPVLGDQVQVS